MEMLTTYNNKTFLTFTASFSGAKLSDRSVNVLSHFLIHLFFSLLSDLKCKQVVLLLSVPCALAVTPQDNLRCCSAQISRRNI